eukprot:TRINITY_DN15659_c0_g1_i1.p1 TRINITY_DN15659_c0_g1~~TRINITY_DN15659_c0_g1_i1.p1  ORF type:complete len:261 (-),score=45.00 TRINITY_DN15659_c0_g1_i1:60-842(-)
MSDYRAIDVDQGRSDGSRVVQQNVLSNLQRVQSNSPRLLFIITFMAIVEMVATAVIVLMNLHHECDKPLQMWVLIFSGRHLINLPCYLIPYYYGIEHAHANKLRALSKLCSYFTLAWFILGQAYVFNTDNCSSMAHTLYVYVVGLVVLTYVMALLPVMVIVMVCVCLPCVLLLSTYLIKPEPSQQEKIDQLPVIKFSTSGVDVSGASNQTNESCSICVSDYQPNEELRVLPCRHLFHKDCVDPWLATQSTCPYCRYEINK